ncbi:AzlD domain-containing protein [Zavarzinia compransoris]|uniref:AzlD family protein n=1 Tax=Zavarzinia marina TaxID=2911065 RepID=UPI001F27BC58|nr:AzlD domain-containing protein [Zavarzinia marina]MCF4167110.1 AzlD domain-containing protein [Zavarzinia marina]
MSVDPDTLLAILAMMAATVACRLVGLLLPAGIEWRGRLAAGLEAMPVAVLAAIVAPTLLATGWAETLAGAAVLLAAWRLPLTAVIVIGIVAAAGFRALAA